MLVGPGAAFGGYWNDEERTQSRVRDGWFVTPHRARIDEEGYVWI